jgi:hypothetical protein
MRDLHYSHKLTPAQQTTAAQRVSNIKQLHNELWTILMQAESLTAALKTTVADFLSSQLQRAVGSPWAWFGSGSSSSSPLAYLGELSHKRYKEFIDEKDPWDRLTIPTSVPCAHPTPKTYWNYTDDDPPSGGGGAAAEVEEHPSPPVSEVKPPRTTLARSDIEGISKTLSYGTGPEPEPEPEPAEEGTPPSSYE